MSTWFNRNEWVDTSAINSCDSCDTCNTRQVSCRFLLIHYCALILSKSSSFNTSTKFQRSNSRELAATAVAFDGVGEFNRGENVAIRNFRKSVTGNPFKTIPKVRNSFCCILLIHSRIQVEFHARRNTAAQRPQCSQPSPYEVKRLLKPSFGNVRRSATLWHLLSFRLKTFGC